MSEKSLPILAGLIGWPVQQSKSPIIHHHWLNAMGIDGLYIRLPVKPGNVEISLRAIRDLGFSGVQATMPHKSDCYKLVDHLSDEAKAICMVNTVTVQPDGSLWGHNTDIAGFLEPLAVHDLSGQAATILGAGGAAAAIAVGLASKKVARINIINRSPEAIKILLKNIAPALVGVEIHYGDWSMARGYASESAIIVNATSLGMKGQLELPLDISMLASNAIAYDIVTYPHKTGFLIGAAQHGLTCYDGLHMLLGQAREAFKLFYGCEAPSNQDDIIRAALIAA